MKFDMVLAGFDFTADNNYVAVKREALKYTGKLTDPNNIKFPSTWDNTNKNSPDYWKNNFKAVDNGKTKNIYSATRITMPSFMISLNKKNAIAFNWSIRNYVNVDGISPELARLAFDEFIYPSLWVTKLQNKRLSVQQMAWATRLRHGRYSSATRTISWIYNSKSC